MKKLESAAIDEAIRSLAELPQFLEAKGGRLLNGISGCVVHNAGTAMVLTWTPAMPSEYLDTPDQVEKFLRLMRMQSASLGAASAN